MPFLSVIVRTRQRPWFLRRALHSTGIQSDGSMEVIVVNDGGDRSEVDGIVRAAHEVAVTKRVIHHQRSMGGGAAMNAGIRSAEGDWLVALDDDDTWDPEFVSSITRKICSKNTDSKSLFGVVTQSTTIWEEPATAGWRQCSSRPFNPRLTQISLRDLVLGNRFTNNAFVFPREGYEKAGPFREDLPVLDDWEFNVRFAARFPIHVVPRPLACYHRRKAGGSEADQNTALTLHAEVRALLRESWIRDDLASGRFGLGALALLSEIEANRGLRLLNRMASWLGR